MLWVSDMKTAVCLVMMMWCASFTEGVTKNGRVDDTWYDCSDTADGLLIGDCTHFYRCENQSTQMLPCPANLVVNEVKMWCDYREMVAPPCGTAPSCEDVIDGNYADYSSHCRRYYTCQHGLFYGYTKCAANLIFNAEKDSCDWPFLARHPCGSGTDRVWPSKNDNFTADRH